MNIRSILGALVLIAISVGCASSTSGIKISGDPGLSFPKEVRIGNIRQLTYEGTNAEAYWSFDGQWLSYQHTGENAECDQIFRISADGKIRNRISNGKGRTTCAYYYPNGKDVLYSSTHGKAAACPASPDKSKGYVWPLYPSFQFYKAKADGSGEVTPIEPGAPSAYNAEMTVCKDGKVVFTSDRNGDLDLYVGKIDSKGFITNIKQVTDKLGYDGGAFFSTDCSKLVWRASRPKPGKEEDEYVKLLKDHLVKPSELEIWMADADGSNAQQVTKLGAASFAPYFSPDNQHILFSTNYRKPGSRNFDIFMIRTNGTELEQVTFSDTFDSFPMFSPDGKYLAFSSNRNARKPRETNVFIADWNARAPGPIVTDEDVLPANRYISIVRELSASDMEGRGVGTDGLGRAEDYVSELFQKAGLSEPKSIFNFGETVKGYEHEIDIIRGVELDDANTILKADWKHLKVKDEFAPASFSALGKIQGRVTDVGYGLVAPELGIDDYADKNIKGRIALVRRRVPHGLKLTPAQENSYGDMKFKAFLARERGAVGVVFWEPEGDEKEKENLMFSINQSTDSIASDSGIPIVIVSRKIAREWVSAPRPVTLSGNIELTKKKIKASNVLGVLGSKEACESKDPVVIGAHLDHLGYGDEGTLESGFAKKMHPGADDNASGIASLVEAARILKKSNAPGCYLFAAFTGEESGIIGSSRLVELIKSRGIQPKAMLNMDMVGRLKNNSIIVFGTDTAKQWPKLLKENCDAVSMTCLGSGDGYGPSDHMPFYIAKVPVLHFFTGPHLDYHRATDTYEKINATGGVQVAELVANVARDVAKPKKVLAYVKSKTSNTMGAVRSRGNRIFGGAYLGTIPDYSQMSTVPGAPAAAITVKGVRLSGVRPNSPAEEAGLREGDIITGITVIDKEQGFAADIPKTNSIQNLQDYTYVLQGLKPGFRIKIQIQRKEEKLEKTATVGRKGDGDKK